MRKSMTLKHWFWLNGADTWRVLSIPAGFAVLTSPFWIYGLVERFL